ncbi:MAG: hypothetical protein D3924_11560 [Candidatus Electrothrix sp. AR4]|nr:hypothetical protein [Candidatus Electrothrix sp. AR4]
MINDGSGVSVQIEGRIKERRLILNGSSMIWSFFNIVLLLLNRITGRSFTVGPAGCRSNPIRCHGPEGERAYLDRLTSHDGRKVLYKRQGSLEIPSPFGNIADAYLIGFEDVGAVKRIYLDMYFEGYMDDRPVASFRLVPAESVSYLSDTDGKAADPPDV